AVLAELRHLGRPHVRRHHVAVLRVARQLAADVVELLEVVVLRALRRLHAERRVAAGAALAGDVVAVLDLLGQREEAPERLVGVVDQRLGDAVVADARETPLAVGGAQLGHEGVAVAVVAADVEGRDPELMVVSCNCRRACQLGHGAAPDAVTTCPLRLRRRPSPRRPAGRGSTASAPRRRLPPSPAPPARGPTGAGRRARARPPPPRPAPALPARPPTRPAARRWHSARSPSSAAACARRPAPAAARCGAGAALRAPAAR